MIVYTHRWSVRTPDRTVRSGYTTRGGRPSVAVEEVRGDVAVRWIDGEAVPIRAGKAYGLAAPGEEVRLYGLAVCDGHASEVLVSPDGLGGVIVGMECESLCRYSGIWRAGVHPAADAALRALLADPRGREALDHAPTLRRLMEEGTDR